MEKDTKMKTKDDVLEVVNNLEVKFVQLWFTDILGQLKSFGITPRELEGAFDEGMGFVVTVSVLDAPALRESVLRLPRE